MKKRLSKKISELFDKESKTLFKNSSWVFIANTYGVGLAFLRSIVIARGLGAEILGIYTVIIAFVVTVQEILKLNVPLGIIKYGAHFISEDRHDKLVSLLKSGIAASMLSSVASVIIISILTHFTYEHFFDIPGLEKFIILYSIINGIAFLDNIGRATLKIYYKFRLNSIVQMTMDTFEFITITTCIYLFHNNLDYFFYSVVFSKLINSTICNLAVFYELRKELKNHLGTRINQIKDQYKEISNFIIGNSFGNTLKTFLNQGDVLLLNIWGSHAAVGLYSVSKKLAYAILTVTDPLVTSIYPQLAHLVSQKKFAELKLMLSKITKLALIPVSIFTLIVFILKGHIITFIYGEEFRAAAGTFFIHFIGAAQGSLFFWCLPLIQGLGLTYLRLQSYLIAIVVDIILAWQLTPQYGANGVAIGLLAANLITTFYFVYYSQRKINSEIRLSTSSI
jgi:O-antigen/teichoic acid export membrane protein